MKQSISSQNDFIYLHYDLETTSTQPHSGELIAIGLVATNSKYKPLGEFHERCNLGRERISNNVYGKEENFWPDPVGGHDRSKWNATDIHKILWSEAQHFQTPIELYRKLWTFLHSLPDLPFKLVFHSQTNFDLNWLLYRTSVWAPKLTHYINSKTCYLEITEDGEPLQRTRYDDTMRMARKYIKSGSDGLKQANKLQKIIDKNQAYLSKDRKTPAKPEQIAKWNDALASAQNDMAILDVAEVQLEGYSLDKICRSLNLELDHHNEMSDARVLPPIHKFLSQHI